MTSQSARLGKVLAVVPLLACGAWPQLGLADDTPWISWTRSGFLRAETALRLTGQENIDNQRGNLFNGVTVARDSTVLDGGPDTATRDVPRADNEWNLQQLRGQVDFSGTVNPNIRIFIRLRGAFEYAQYDEYDPADIDSQAVGTDYQVPEYFEHRNFDGGGSSNPLEFEGRRYMIDLPSLYVDYQSGPLLLRFGQQQIAWGQALFFRVLDVPNGLDLRRHLFLDYAPEEYSDERIGSLGLRATWQVDSRWEVDGFVQRFLPTVYPNPNTPYNAISSQFSVHNQFGEYNGKLNGGLRARGNFGQWSVQFITARRYNPDGVFRWTESGVSRDLPGLAGAFPDGTTGAILSQTAFEVDPSGVQSATEWFTYAAHSRLNGVTGLNASINEFPAAALLGAVPTTAISEGDPDVDFLIASQELDLFFQLSGGLRGHIAREYFRETNIGAGVGYVFEGEGGSFLDQLIVNIEAAYTPDRVFTNTSLSRDYIVEDEIVAALVMEKFHRFTREFPATYMVFQWMHRTESDLFGRHLSGMGGTVDGVAQGVSGGWNGLVFALQQATPNLTWRYDAAILYDTRGGILFQPALRWTPNTTWNVEVFYNMLQGNLHGDDNENIIQTLEYADELGVRVGFQF